MLLWATSDIFKMFFTNYKTIFVHIPKTGGSSLEYAICKKIFNTPSYPQADKLGYENLTINGFFKKSKRGTGNGHPHSCISEYAKYLPIEEYIKFTVLRNPFDQVISLYNQMRKIIHIPSLEHFIMSNDANSIRNYSHYIDQYKYTHIDNQFKIDKVFIFDCYEEVQDFVEKKFELKIDRDKRIWQTEYTKEDMSQEMKNKFESIHFKSIDLYNKFHKDKR